MFHWGIQFRDGGDGILVMAGIPWIFAIYIGLSGVLRVKKECELGVSFHDNTLYFKTFSFTMEWNSRDPWWRKGFSITMPWELKHYLTEILSQDSRQVVWSDRGKKFMDSWNEREKAKSSVSETHPYVYRLKNGETQIREATIFVERMEWRARWYPIIWRKKVRTYIDVHFNEEVGEGAGSWKGGCVGTGYELNPGETPLECLRRMEREHKFNR